MCVNPKPQGSERGLCAGDPQGLPASTSADGRSVSFYCNLLLSFLYFAALGHLLTNRCEIHFPLLSYIYSFLYTMNMALDKMVKI